MFEAAHPAAGTAAQDIRPMKHLPIADRRATAPARGSRARRQRSTRTLQWLSSAGPALVALAAVLVGVLQRSRLRQELWAIELRRHRTRADQ